MEQAQSFHDNVNNKELQNFDENNRGDLARLFNTIGKKVDQKLKELVKELSVNDRHTKDAGIKWEEDRLEFNNQQKSKVHVRSLRMKLEDQVNVEHLQQETRGKVVPWLISLGIEESS